MSYKADYTPPHIAAQMVELAEIKKFQTIMEPSAGIGNIAREILKGSDSSNNIILNELNKGNFETLVKSFTLPSIKIFKKNFLTTEWEDIDRIIMCPPTKEYVGAQHVMKAFDSLSKDGILVALLNVIYKTYEPLKMIIDNHEHKAYGVPEDTFVYGNEKIISEILVIKK